MRDFRQTLIAALAALSLAALGACTRVPETRQVSLPPAPDISQTQTASDRENQRILASYGGEYRDPKLEALLNKTVDRLVAASERPDLKYRVVILNSPAINAFSLPNGQLYVTRGLIALANDTSEVGSVLAHEMAHVIARHAALREDKARQSIMISSVVTDVLGDPQLGALALAKSKLALASFSRAQEFEADGIGVGIAARAGYDPYGAVRYLNSMQRNASVRSTGSSTDQYYVEFMSSHPTTPARIRNAIANARQFGAPGTGERDRPVFLAALNGMVFGEDPSEGFVRGRRFLHPKLGFTFEAPPNFTLENTAEAVLGVRDGGGQAMRVDVVRVPAEQSLSDYLRSGWMDNVSAISAENFEINGFPAAGATATGGEWTFRLYAVRFGSEVYRFIFAAKQLTPAAERAFRGSIGTFRRMTLKEIRGAKPLKISVVTVRPGDTIDSLAQRMALPDHKRERFMALNELSASDKLKPGSQLKLVIE
ncbi:M48 family metalloprotease [Pseudolabrys sp.]|uniref:M48 family metalloprotease n=1 Tax=Pseudolabrys sp. TaxID=1960880 RepID=UPI003D0D3F04